MGFLTKNSSEKSNAPRMPGVPSLGLNIDRCIIHYSLIPDCCNKELLLSFVLHYGDT